MKCLCRSSHYVGGIFTMLRQFKELHSVAELNQGTQIRIAEVRIGQDVLFALTSSFCVSSGEEMVPL